MMTFDELLGIFLDSREAQDCSKSTIIWYRSVLCKFGVWLATNDKDALTLTPMDLQKFIVQKKKGYSQASVRQHVGAIKAFFNWLEEMDVIERNPARKVKRPKESQLLPIVVTEDDLKRMLAAIQPVTWIDQRDVLLLNLLFYSGLRIAEAARLRLDDVDLNNRRLRVLRKGGRQHWHPIPPRLAEALRLWICDQRPPLDDPQLFLSSANGGIPRGGLSTAGAQCAVYRRAHDAGLAGIHPHSFRHGFAHWLLKSGASTRLIQELLGHSFIATTERYLRMTPLDTQAMADGIWGKLEQGRTQ